MRLGLGLGFGRSGNGSGYYILLGGVYGGAFNETTGAIGPLDTATTNLPGTIAWSIEAGGDADISINSSSGSVSSARAIYAGDDADFTVIADNGTIAIGFPFTATGTVSPYETESDALFARFTSDPGTTRKGHIDTLIAALKSGGVWTKLDALYLTGAHDAQAAQRNWIANSYNLTPNNAPTFTTDRGYTGNGSNATLSTGFIPSSAPSPKYTLNSATLGAWVLTNITGLSEYAIGSVSTASAGINPRSTSANTLRGQINTTASLANFGTSATSVGMATLSRTGSTTMTRYKNATADGSAGFGAIAVPSVEIILLGYNSTTASNHQIFAAFIGSGLTGAEVTTLYNAIDAYRVALGA